jgi:hypothetical protein
MNTNTPTTELERASYPARALADAVDDGKVRMSALLQAIGINANDPVHQAALLACDKYDLDPLRKEVIVIPRGGPYVTRDGYLRVAHRSGQLDGIVIEATGETPTHHTARVAVYRKDMKFPFTYDGRYPKSGTNKQYGPEMAITRAERTALSRAFPVEGMSAGDHDFDRTPADTTETVAEIEEIIAVKDWVAEHGEPEPIDVDTDTGEIADLFDGTEA